MPTSKNPPITSTTTLAAALAGHATETPEEPWLFYRQHHDWQWRSWSQTAHQVVEGAQTLRRSPSFEAGETRVPVAATMDPDALALDLAIQLVGGEAVPVAADDQNQAADDQNQVIVLPTAPSRLSRWTTDLTALRAKTVSAADVWLQAHRWRELFPAASARKRPIVLASASIDFPVRRTLMAWTLLEAAAWVLEKDPERFVTAVLRNRPTLVLAPASDAGLLALAFQERRFRRWHRLQAVALTDDAPSEIAREAEWHQMGIPVLRLAVSPPPGA